MNYHLKAINIISYKRTEFYEFYFRQIICETCDWTQNDSNTSLEPILLVFSETYMRWIIHKIIASLKYIPKEEV